MSERRCEQLIRTWRLVALLRSTAGCSLEKLSRDLGVTTRTIRRDLEALQAAGIAIYDEESEAAKVWRLVKGAACPVCGKPTIRSHEVRRELMEIGL